MYKLIYILLFLLVILGTNVQAQEKVALETTVIQLQHRSPNDIIPVLKSFLDKNGQISGYENQIILQTSLSNLATLQKMIQDLDKPVQQLMISVSNGTEEPSGVQGNQTISTQRDEDTQINHVRVENNHVAFISTGITIPLIREQYAGSNLYNQNGNIQGGIIGDGQINASEVATAYGKSVDYKNLSNGIFVKPQLMGNEVRLELLSKNDQPIQNQTSSTSPAYTTLKSETTLRVPMGKWVYFGGNRDPNEMRTGTSYSTQSREQSQKNLWLKVDVISE